VAQDIIPMEPKEAICPHCGKPVLVEWQLAYYADGGVEHQFLGLKVDEKAELDKRIYNPVTQSFYSVLPRASRRRR